MRLLLSGATRSNAVTLVRCNKMFCGYSCPVQQKVLRFLLALCYKKFFVRAVWPYSTS